VPEVKKPRAGRGGKEAGLSGPAKAKLLAARLDEKQAEDITILDVASLCPVSEAVLVASAKGVRHAQALADAVLDKAGEQGFEFLGMEGYQAGAWVLLDLNDVIVHVFQREARLFYNIEGLWSEAETVDWTPAPAGKPKAQKPKAAKPKAAKAGSAKPGRKKPAAAKGKAGTSGVAKAKPRTAAAAKSGAGKSGTRRG
jgi:ribosome-associated protein